MSSLTGNAVPSTPASSAAAPRPASPPAAVPSVAAPSRPPRSAGGRPVALVTGARRGIGRAIAEMLARQGFDLALSDRQVDDDAQQTCAAAAGLGARVRFDALDVADVDAHPAAIAAVMADFGRIDCLVNNAGISVAQRGDLLAVSPESFDRLIAVNLRGPFFLSQAVARHFLDHPAAGAYRSIINISSANAFAASLNRAEYCLSKAAITMSTQLFALRLAEAGVGVFEIRPGVIRTDMTRVAAADYDARIRDGLTPIRRWGEPEDIGRAVASLAIGTLGFSTGDALHIDGGLHIRKL